MKPIRARLAWLALLIGISISAGCIAATNKTLIIIGNESDLEKVSDEDILEAVIERKVEGQTTNEETNFIDSTNDSGVGVRANTAK